MITVIAQIIFALSIIGILIISLKKIPAVLKYPRNSSKTVSIQTNLRNHWDKVKEETGISGFFHNTLFPKMEKFLRKIKIILLKFDNFLARRVDGLRKRMKRKK